MLEIEFLLRLIFQLGHLNTYTDYGLVRKLPSLHGKKSTPTPKISDTAKAYFVKLNFILKNIENKSLVCLSFPWGLEKNILDILWALQKPQTAFRMPNLKLKSQTMFIKNASLLPLFCYICKTWVFTPLS